MKRWKNNEGRYMMAIDATYQVCVDKLPLIFVGIISPADGFLPVLAALQDKLDTETFRLIFRWIKENGFPEPTALQADGDKATRKAAREIWPDIDLCMCWYHVKKNCKRELSKLTISHQNISFSHQMLTLSHQNFFFSGMLAKNYPELCEALLLDLEELRTFTLDHESFLVLEPLWERKWLEETRYPDSAAKKMVSDFILYYKREWVQPELVRGWWQGAAPLCVNTNNNLEM